MLHLINTFCVFIFQKTIMTSMEHSAVGFDDPTLIDPLSAILNNLTQELEASDNISVPLDLKVCSSLDGI
jgi:hypothetical protein